MGAAQRVIQLLCDSGLLIASYNVRDAHHESCLRLLRSWTGRLLVPEPVLGETCNFLRNHVRHGPVLEARFLESMTATGSEVEIVNPVGEDRQRATELAVHLAAAPLGYVDATIIAMAERLGIADIATLDFKFLGMASQVSRLQPLRWVVQEA
ncbi:MAG: PIN domain-containing protein [Streptosporangiales bacterium]|nr:PIN domain-containing protein [Streptosporangiales bacterium]